LQANLTAFSAYHLNVFSIYLYLIYDDSIRLYVACGSTFITDALNYLLSRVALKVVL